MYIFLIVASILGVFSFTCRWLLLVKLKNIGKATTADFFMPTSVFNTPQVKNDKNFKKLLILYRGTFVIYIGLALAYFLINIIINT